MWPCSCTSLDWEASGCSEAHWRHSGVGMQSQRQAQALIPLAEERRASGPHGGNRFFLLIPDCFVFLPCNHENKIKGKHVHQPFNNSVPKHKYWLYIQTRWLNSNYGCANHLLAKLLPWLSFQRQCNILFAGFSLDSSSTCHLKRHVSHQDKYTYCILYITVNDTCTSLEKEGKKNQNINLWFFNFNQHPVFWGCTALSWQQTH